MTGPLNVPSRLRAIASRRGHQIALIDPWGHTTWTEMIDGMDGVAAALRGTGLAAGDRVAIAMEPSTTYVTVVLGALGAGLVPVPINTRLTPYEIAAFLEPIQPALVVTDHTHVQTARATGYDVVVLAASHSTTDLRARLAPLAGEPTVFAPVSEDSPAIIFATGGTTGIPKGVWYDHRGLWLWLNASAASNPGTRFDVELYFAPFFHIALGTNLLSRLFAGGTVHILRKFDATLALEAIARGATRITGAPTMFAAIKSHESFESTPRGSMRALRLGSMAANADFIAQVMRDYPTAAIRTGYGATEFGPLIGVEHEDLVAGRLTGIGRPHPGAEARILRADGTEADCGEVGEIVVSAPWQSRGYWGRPDETEATYTAEGIRTGDLGAVDDDGWFSISGRLKEMVITGGENVFPTEVEDVLRRHQAVHDVIVYGVPDEYWGERVEVGIVCAEGGDVELDELREFARPYLAGYKLPKSLVRIREVPLTTVQKPDRRAARAASIESSSV
ncbi:acyl--CoA ligase [Rhodococcus sp. BP-332]|uniref:class I adenylate-forming enzyme family protein n=1 Tax=Rhodococcus sp. BP-332 TaxID=2739447 RepID=UPI001C9BB515|nr:class I adenylate-forming enzyme family protein [Rhodococcus sp. BP-332]MBY6679252.1 acyl--CoA ligase [Rhodococcus sp. BP-332]